MNPEISALKEISSWVASDISHIQGAGGNSSVKYDNGNMVIKASGKNMKQLIAEDAYITINGSKIKELLCDENFDITDSTACNNLNNEIKNTIVTRDNDQWLPSMETAFHTLFYKYTLHTHNAWSNVLMCSDAFESLDFLFAEVTDYTLSSIGEYFTPGIPLSWHIYNAFRFDEEMPNVVFLPNHGIIYSHNDVQKLKDIIADVQFKILGYLKANSNEYPTYTITQKENGFVIDCPFLISSLGKKRDSPLFNELLFPDQAIYIDKAHFGFNDSQVLYNIDVLNNKIISTANEVTSCAVIETALAFAFIWQQCENREYEPLTINWEWQFLTSMQTEQHRIKMLND